MRKPAFCIFENKGADQLLGNRGADQHLCFSYPYFLNPKFQACGSTARFVSDLVENPENRVSHAMAHLYSFLPKVRKSNMSIRTFVFHCLARTIHLVSLIEISRVHRKTVTNSCHGFP